MPETTKIPEEVELSVRNGDIAKVRRLLETYLLQESRTWSPMLRIWKRQP